LPDKPIELIPNANLNANLISLLGFAGICLIHLPCPWLALCNIAYTNRVISKRYTGTSGASTPPKWGVGLVAEGCHNNAQF
jgi:hypothetical protein